MKLRPVHANSIIDLNDPVAKGETFRPVGDDDDRRAGIERAQPFEDLPFTGYIDGTRGLIQDHEERLA
jgi:hypothetical protein